MWCYDPHINAFIYTTPSGEPIQFEVSFEQAKYLIKYGYLFKSEVVRWLHHCVGPSEGKIVIGLSLYKIALD